MFLVRSGAIDGFVRLVDSLGGKPSTLLQQVGLSYTQLRNPNTYISYSKLAELLEHSAAACDEPLFGMRLARSQTNAAIGDIVLTLSQQPTVGAALASINKYLYLHASGAHVTPQLRGDSCQVELSLDISTPLGLNQLIQMSIGQLANFAAGLLDIPSHTVAIYLRQSSPVAAPLLGEEPAFQAVAFGADSDYIRVPAHCLDKKPYRDEGALLKHLQEYTQLLQQRYPGSLQDQVRDIIGQALPSGECSIERVAATLDLHPRVLQKRLQQQGTSYVQLLQETRLCMAKEYLRMRKVSITDLALNLGYADVSVFSRSFKRLTGMSARQWQSLYGATR